jgi:hypothetical protein
VYGTERDLRKQTAEDNEANLDQIHIEVPGTGETSHRNKNFHTLEKLKNNDFISGDHSTNVKGLS